MKTHEPIVRRRALAAVLAPGRRRCRKAATSPATIVASGHVEATEVRVSTKVAGAPARAVRRRGRPWSSAGQELARIDTTDTELALRQPRAPTARRPRPSCGCALAGSREEDIARGRAQVARAEADLAGREQGPRAHGGPARLRLRHDQGARRRAHPARRGARDASTPRSERAARLEAGYRAARRSTRRRARAAGAPTRASPSSSSRSKDAVIASPVDGRRHREDRRAGRAARRAARRSCVVTDLAERVAHRLRRRARPRPDPARARTRRCGRTTARRARARSTFVASQAEFTPKNVQTRDERVKLVYRVKVGARQRGRPVQARHARRGAPRCRRRTP